MIHIHENGITVVATNEAKRGKVYELNGEKYYIARGVADIKRIVDSGEYPLNRVITSKLTSLNYLFQIRGGYQNKAVPDNFNDEITNWDTSNILSMEEVFSWWPTFNQDISNWDTSRVESMHGMFKSSKYVGNYHMGDTSFNQDISKWDVRNVKNMSEMFLGATSFNQDISNWNVSNVTNMDHMFSGATSFNQPIGNWDTSSVESMRGIFSDVVSIGIVAFVGTYDYTKAGSTSFNQDISNWDVSNVKNMSNMFSGATSFNQDISNWDVSDVKTMSNMFQGATSFNQPIGNWDVSNVTDMDHMFSGTTSFNQPIGDWDTSSVKNMFYMFLGATSFNQPIGNWDVSSVDNMNHMFSDATSFNQDLNAWNLSSLSGVEGMFSGATSFNQPIGNWDVSNVKDMSDMFSGAKSFNQDISNWNVSSVIQMKGLFQEAISFNQNISNWKLNKELPKSRTIFKDADAFNIKEFNPFSNIKAKKRDVDTSTANLSPDDKRTFSKIKKLIVARDTDQIDMAVELTISLNNSNIFKTLLDGCKLTQVESSYRDGGIESKLTTNKLFTGSGPAQPFLNYALISIIANVPDNDDILIDDSLKIKNITELNLSSISFKHDWDNFCKTPDVSKLIYLEKFSFDGSLPENAQFKSVKELKCKDIEGSLKWLAGFNQLEKLDMHISSYGDGIKDIDSFKNLVSLTEFELLPGGKLTDINFLSECEKIKKLTLHVGKEYGNDEEVKCISVLPRLKNLEELNISGVEGLDITPIGECKNLININIGFKDDNLSALSTLNSCTELKDLTISGGSAYELNAKVESINGINLAENLKTIRLAESWNKSIKISGIDGGNLLNNKPKLKSSDSIKRVNDGELTDIDSVTHYRGVPFTGIMYYNFSEHRKEYDIVEQEYEMVKGSKHGSYKHFYSGDKLAGKLRIEHNYIDDEHDKIIGFYDGSGNNYVGENPCLGASSLELLANGKPVFVSEYGSNRYNVKQDNPTSLEGALFYHNDNVFSGQVLLHKYVSNWQPLKEFNRSLYGIIYEAIENHVPGVAPDNENISFLITIKQGRLTGEFCASTPSKFFSGNTDELETQNPISIMKIKDSSNKKSNELSLQDKSIVVTGVFENYSRNELKALIKENGGSPSSSVTSNTFLILAGSKMGSKKKILAEELGIKIIDIDTFIEKYINESEDKNTETETETYFIDIFYPEHAKKKTVSKKNLKSEDKKTFTKIKSLLQARDFDKVDMGIELLRSVNIIDFYEALLDDCKINTTASGQDIIANKFFTGSGPAQPYLNYGLYLLIYYCPEDAEIDNSIRKENINKLNTDMFFTKSYDVKYRLPLIENFTSLYELEINLGSFNLDYSKPEDVLKNSSVKKMRINEPKKSLMLLKNFPQLNNLSMSADGYGEASKDMNVFENLTNLEELEMSYKNSKNIDFLKNCIEIKKLKINLTGTYSSASKVQNIDVLKYLTKLEDLDILIPEDDKIEGGESFSYKGLSYCENLKNLNISSNAGVEVLTNLKNCSALEKIDLQSKEEFNIKLNMSSFYGINKLYKLKKLSLGHLNLLESNTKLFIK